MRDTALPDPIRTAQQLIERHGLRAAAVASEHLSEAQADGDATALHRWSQVRSAIVELRTSERNVTTPVRTHA